MGHLESIVRRVRVRHEPVPSAWNGETDAPDARPRVLVESADFAVATAVTHVLDDAGFAVAVCHGPGGDHGCTLLETGACALVHDADVVINLLGLGDEHRRDLVSALRATYPEVPLVVELTGPEREHHREFVGDARVLDAPIRGETLLAQVAEATTDAH